ncbi:hypothetical protein NDU88_011141 [Pleurodeles waltl]|uniref:Uncharacterized protein n=1 Tax=Pleurodeles waltl TaxID=8319 RepID=A0AAV7QZ83_PLEWA|nr:hypothetical protein NDU88_011141 [Pleurodeles waltl]
MRFQGPDDSRTDSRTDTATPVTLLSGAHREDHNTLQIQICLQIFPTLIDSHEQVIMQLWGAKEKTRSSPSCIHPRIFSVPTELRGSQTTPGEWASRRPLTLTAVFPVRDRVGAVP